MTSAPVCTQCRAAVPIDLINFGDLAHCPSCNTEIEVEIFPAFFRPPARGSFGEALVVETHTSCFFHAQKQAAHVCATCGRFICSLCEMDLEGQHLCPPCLEAAQKTGKIKSLESRRVLHDTIALNLALLGILLFYFSFITAPLALYLAIRNRNAPPSLIGTSKVRRGLAIVLSSLQILGWIALVIFLVGRN
jgi:hypothetical protein